MSRATRCGVTLWLTCLMVMVTGTGKALAQPGSIDPSFPATVDGPVYALAIQPDGKYLVAGGFTMVNGDYHPGLVRLLTNGNVDEAFAFYGVVNAASTPAYALATHSTDGRVVIGGAFTSVTTVDEGSGELVPITANRVATVFSNGDVDGTFVNNANASGEVYALATFPSGVNRNKVLMGGVFTMVNGALKSYLARLNADGTLDATFAMGSGPNESVYALLFQLDGKLLVGGAFTSFNGTNRAHIARLNADGSLDSTFNPGLGANDVVLALGRQSDGKILVGGMFTMMNGIPRFGLARLNTDGTLDAGFMNGLLGMDDYVSAIAVQTNGQVVVGGAFTSVNGLNRSRFVRLNADGSVDNTINFGTGADNFVAAAAVDRNGRLLAGGGFSTFNGAPVSYLARLNGGAQTNNGQIAFSSASYGASESGGQTTITLKRTGGLVGTVSVQYAATNGTAIPGVDYVSATGQVTFPAGVDEQTFTITLLDDAVADGDQTVTLTLSGASGGATIGAPSTATLSIVDDESIVSLASDNYVVNEGDGVVNIKVTRTGGSFGFAAVDYLTIAGTAVEGLDYTNQQDTIFFEPGETEASIKVPLVDDVLVEGSETFFLVLTNPVGTVTLGQAMTTVLIADNDYGPGTIEFALDSYNFSENVGTANISVVRRYGSSGFVSVSYATANGTALSGADYTGKTNSLSFAPGQTSKSITIAVNNDTLLEGQETFQLRLYNPTGGAALGRTDATVRLVDDDFIPGSPGRIELDASALTVDEGGGALQVTVRRTEGTNGTAAVNYATYSGTAVSPGDYTPVAGVLVFAGTETLKTFSVPIINDRVGEGAEYFGVQLFSATNAVLGMPSYAMVSIEDDDLDPGSLGFSATNYSVMEGANRILLTVIRTNGLSGPVGVNVFTVDDTAVGGTDYTSVSTNLVFPEGVDRAILRIDITDNPDTNENKQFFVQLVGPTNGASLITGFEQTTITILDDDYEAGLAGAFSFESATYQTNESGGAVRLSVIRQWGRTGKVDVEWTTRDGSARNGRDYTGGTTNKLTFDDGVTRQTITVPLLDNIRLDGERDFTVRLLTNGLPAGASLGSPRDARVTILDDDAQWGDVRLVSMEYSVGEEMGYAVVTVGRYGGNFGTVSVDYLVNGGTAAPGVDFVPVTGTLTFFATESTTQAVFQTFTIPILNDLLTNGPRTVSLMLSNLTYLPLDAPGVPSLSRQSATLTIYDDEGYLSPPGTSGQFQFSRSHYYQTDREGSYGYYYYYDDYTYGYGAVITVTRVGEARGRAYVDYEIMDPRDPFGTGIGYYPYLNRYGTLVFDDYQMSANIYLGNYYYYYYSITNQNQELFVQLSNPRGAPGEPTPTLGFGNSANVTIYGTRRGFNFVNAVTRVPEWVGNANNPNAPSCQCVRLAVSRELTNVDVSVEWEAPAWRDYSYRNYYSYSGTNYYYDDYYGVGTLQSGSDFALPPHGGYVGDYTPVRGTITWGKDDYDIKYIDIPITDDQEVEFNEDFFVYLRIPDARRGQPGETLGPMSIAVVTILADDANRLLDLQYGSAYGSGNPGPYRNEQPAGAADLNWNRDQSGYVTEPNPRYNDAPGANNRVYALAVQPDGKVVLGGEFTGYNAVGRNRIARADQVGEIDLSFDPGTGADGYVNAIALYESSLNQGRMIIGGGFTSINGQSRYGVARLNTNGVLDTTFRPGSGANGAVRSLAIQPDDKVIIGGDFTLFDGTNRNHVARLNESGSLDATFNVGTGADGPVYAVALGGAGGRVLVGGSFGYVNGQPRSGIARLNANGSVDSTFDTGGAIDGRVYAMVVQPDGRVIIGGDFTQVNLKPRRGIARLDTDGRVDSTFSPGTGFDDIVYALALQPDGRVLVGGLFTEFDGARRVGVARLLPGGSLDTSIMDAGYNQFAGLPKTFSYDPPSYVSAVAYQSDGTYEYVLIGGSFTRVGGGYTRGDIRFRSNIARLVGGGTPGPGNIELTMDGYGADESGTSANFTLRRVNGRLGAVAVNYVTADLTATGYSDYGSRSGTAIWDYGIFGGSVGGDQLSDGDTRSFVYSVPVYNDGMMEGDETFSLMLTNPTSVFYLAGLPIPLGAALGRSAATVTIIDDDFSPGVLGFAAPTFTVNEEGVDATISVTRTNGSTGVVTVDYATGSLPAGPGAATAGTDYTPRSGTLSFASGETNKTFTVPIMDDTGVELDEGIRLTLSLPSGGAALGLATATLLIIDNDFLPGRLNFAVTNFPATENGGAATVTVTRSGGNLGALSAQVVTADGTATRGSDYVALTNTVVWGDGDSAPKSVTIPLMNDGWVEGEETIQVLLVNPSAAGALGSLTNAAVTISDDDRYGTFAFSAPNYNANENGGRATITVVRTDGSAEVVSVSFSVAIGSTNSAGAFVGTNSVLTFGDGETAKSFDVVLVDNTTADDTKTLLLTLADPQPPGALLGYPNPASLTIIDDESANVPAGSLDTSFRAEPGPDGPVYALALEVTGNLVIGGDFSNVSTAARRRIARLLPSGALDFGYDPGTGANGSVRALAMLSSGKTVVGGFFTRVNDVPRNYIARLNTGGSVDSSFNPGSGLDNPVYALAIQRMENQERVLIGGGFTTVNGINRNFVARLLESGALDTTFDPGMGANDTVFALAVQPDGKVLIGGDFTLVHNTSRNHVARLNRDGSLDLSFDPGAGADASVRAIAVQPDGKIVVGGLFTLVRGTNLNHVARLNADGSLDAGFKPGAGADNPVYAIALQEDGKIVLGGDFTTCNGVTRNRITRLNADGTVDPTINFGVGANSFVAGVAIQPDGKLVIGGGFTTVDDVPRNRVARLHGGSLTGSGSLEFSRPNYSVLESGLQAAITVRRIGGTTGTGSVYYATSPGTASSGEYGDVSGVLVFPTGETRQTFQVPVFDNQVVNADATVNLILSNFVGLLPGPQPSATLTIINDDSLVGFETATFSANENALGGRAVITVTRTGSTNGTVAVDYATVGNLSATPNQDFVPVNGLLVFGPGETNRSFTITILDDFVVEGNETLSLSLLNPIGRVVMGQGEATLAIVDNDFAPGNLVFSSPIYVVNEDGGSARITVIRTNGTTGIVSAQYATSDGSARMGQDYGTVTGIVAFADGQVSNTFTVPILWDTAVEPDETATLRLLNPTGGATLGTPGVATLVIVNVGGFPPPGTVVSNFNTGVGPNNPVLSASPQSDGRLVIGGLFTQYGGASRNYLARLNPDGALDTSFSLGVGADNMVWSTAVRADGRVLLGGAFLSFNGMGRSRVAQVLANGAVDTGFSPGDLNATVYSVAAHGDGAILGGAFDYTPTATTNVARLDAAGALDPVFNTGLAVNGPVHAVAVQPDGRVIIAGNFTRVRGTLRGSVARLNANGTLDSSFGSPAGVNGIVYAVALAANGQVIVGGDFMMVDGVSGLNNVARLGANGLVDSAFAPPGGANDTVYSVAVQPDGKVIVGGDFTQFNGFSRNRIVRLTAEGLVDQSFVVGSGANSTVYSVALQPDQRVVLAGDFTSVNGEPHNRVAQLLGGEPFAPEGMKFLAVAARPNGDVLITIQSQPGHVYALDAAAGLQGPWTLFDVRNAVGNTLTFIDVVAPGQRFYRVRRAGP